MVSLSSAPVRRIGPRRVAAAVGRALIAAPLAVVALKESGAGAVMAGAALVVLASLPLLLRLRTERLDAPGVYGAVAAVLLGVTSLAWVSGTAPTPGPSLDRAEVAHAEVLVAVGLAVFALGAILTAGRQQATPPSPGSGAQGPIWQVVLAAYAVCAGAIVVGIKLGAYGYLSTPQTDGTTSSVLSFLGSQSSVVILAAGVAWLRDRDPRLRRALIAMLAVQVPLGFVTGVKGDSVLALVLLLLAAIAYRRPIPWKPLGIAVLVLIGVLLPANNAYRDSLRTRGHSVAASIRSLVDPSIYRPDRTLGSAVTYLFSRFREIDHVALIEHDTPSLFAYGDGSNYTLLPLIIAVPRALWHGKPVLDTAGQFARTYWQIPPSIHTSQPLTQVGDLYRNFAWPGVIVGMLVWGALIGAWERLRRARASPRMTVVYLWSLLAAVTYVESDLPALIATTAKELPITYLAAWFLLPGRDSTPGYRLLVRRLTRKVRPPVMPELD